MESQEVKKLEIIAAKCGRKVARKVKTSGAGHLGGALSCIDIAIALNFPFVNNNFKNSKMSQKNRLILSAGHKCMAQYSILARWGFSPEAIIDTYSSHNSKIPSHLVMYKLQGIEENTGALDRGPSITTGMALGLKNSNHRF